MYIFSLLWASSLLLGCIDCRCPGEQKLLGHVEDFLKRQELELIGPRQDASEGRIHGSTASAVNRSPPRRQGLGKFWPFFETPIWDTPQGFADNIVYFFNRYVFLRIMYVEALRSLAGSFSGSRSMDESLFFTAFLLDAFICWALVSRRELTSPSDRSLAESILYLVLIRSDFAIYQLIGMAIADHWGISNILVIAFFDGVVRYFLEKLFRFLVPGVL